MMMEEWGVGGAVLSAVPFSCVDPALSVAGRSTPPRVRSAASSSFRFDLIVSTRKN